MRLLVDRIQHLVPASDGGDDAVRIGGPDEGLRVGIVVGDEAVDACLQERKTPRLSRRLVSRAKKPSTAFSHEQEVGTKWKVKRGWRSSQRQTFGCLWAA